MKHLSFIFALYLYSMPALASFASNPENELSASSTAFIRLTCQLPAPSSFNGEPTDFGSVFLEWSPVSGAVSYRLIVYKLDSNELVSNTVQYGTQTQLGGLQEGVTYRCTLASMCSGGSTSDFIIYEDILL